MKTLLCLAIALLIVGCREVEPRNPHPRRESVAPTSSVACVGSLWWRQPYTADPATHGEWDRHVPQREECDETDADSKHFEEHNFRAAPKPVEPPAPQPPPAENVEEI